MGWTSSLFGGGRNVDPETDGNNFGFVAAGSRAGAGDDVLLEDLEEDRTDLLRIILYGAFLEFYKIELLGQRGCRGDLSNQSLWVSANSRPHTEITIPHGCALYACTSMCIAAGEIYIPPRRNNSKVYISKDFERKLQTKDTRQVGRSGHGHVVCSIFPRLATSGGIRPCVISVPRRVTPGPISIGLSCFQLM